ncbi:hypothetical protein RUM44_009738 [Polyplax serrata]|uniref:Uncharacterized protein n=1 Tax=Polyplax serrata TaxID=468196 RepID=A0ABR1AU56_POLSC
MKSQGNPSVGTDAGLSRKHAIKAPERIKKFRLTRRKIGNGEKKLWRKDERVKEEDEKEEKIKLTTS